MTDREMERRHLAMSDRHLAEGADRIAKQRVFIAELAHSGRDTAEAVRLLVMFRAVQEAGVAHRQLILEALGDPGDGAADGQAGPA